MTKGGSRDRCANRRARDRSLDRVRLVLGRAAVRRCRRRGRPTSLPSAPSSLLYPSSNGVYASTPPLSTDMRVSIAGVVARVSIVQTFANTGGEFSEAVYALPLPDDAAVDRLTMKVGDRVVEGEIHEREQAEHVYARREPRVSTRASCARTRRTCSRRPSRTSRRRGDRDHDRIFADGRYDNGELSLRVPMTYTERYGVDTQADPAGFDALADGALTRGANSAFAASAVSSTVVGARVAGYSGPPVRDDERRGQRRAARRRSRRRSTSRSRRASRSSTS